MKMKTLFLVLSNALTGTLMFCFSIMLSRRIGSPGMGLYQLAMPIYALFLCISGGGITISISKLAAEEKGKNNTYELYKTIHVICIFEIIWSVIVTFILILLSGYIATDVLNEPRTQYLIIAFSPAIIFVSISSVYKGAYYGIQKIIEPALIDIIEKVVRIGFIIIAFDVIPKEPLELTAAVAILSLSLGEFSSFILFFTAFNRFKSKNPPLGKSDNSLQLVINTLKLSFPLAINGILSTVFTTFTTLIIPSRLQQTGMSHETSVMLLGKLQGMVLTIIFYPTIIIGSMNVLLVPALSEALATKKLATVKRHINTAFTVASLTAFSSACILLSSPKDIGILFYKDSSLGGFLYQLGPSIPLVYLEITSFAILNGLGKQKSILINSTLLSTIELILLYILLGIPHINVAGYSIDFFVISILGLIINLYIIKHTMSVQFNLHQIITFPALCSVLTYFVSKNLLFKLNNIPLLIVLGYICYFALYFLIQSLNPDTNPLFKRRNRYNNLKL